MNGFSVRFNFSKMVRDFSNENNSKTNLNCHSPWLRDEENFFILHRQKRP